MSDARDVPAEPVGDPTDAALRDIQLRLRRAGRSLEEFGLPTPQAAPGDEGNANPLVEKERGYDQAELLATEALLGDLTPEQRGVYDAVLDDVEGRVRLFSALPRTPRRPFVHLHDMSRPGCRWIQSASS